MPIFTKNGKRVMFAHIPKTGGSSVIAMAKSNGWEVEPGIPQHATAMTYASLEYDSAFAVVREPVERMKSFLAWRRILPDKGDDFIGAAFRGHMRMTHEKSGKELKAIEEGGWISGFGPMVMPQTWFIADDCEWARYGEEDALLEKHLGTSKRELVNVSKVPKHELDRSTIDFIHEFYAADYERFYQTPGD